ncbi:hypothetical protein [Oceanobacter mangrovi]|uniref:hypothetical protein n=1 Tax=Oceanobacter mangrovi TaxID=2862510 RepID=UPI001C8DE09D|nr:hypothetical protein [Oceanobacter mangrovi]
MKFWVAGMLWLTTSLALAADDSALNVEQAKRSVIELNNELITIEKQLTSPIVSKAAVYIALADGQFFKPMSVELSGAGIAPITYTYTEKEVQALSAGAIQPLADFVVSPGFHKLRAVFKGKDGNQQIRNLVYEGTFRKTDQHLKLLLTISDNSALHSASATLKAW